MQFTIYFSVQESPSHWNSLWFRYTGNMLHSSLILACYSRSSYCRQTDRLLPAPSSIRLSNSRRPEVDIYAFLIEPIRHESCIPSILFFFSVYTWALLGRQSFHTTSVQNRTIASWIMKLATEIVVYSRSSGIISSGQLLPSNPAATFTATGRYVVSTRFPLILVPTWAYPAFLSTPGLESEWVGKVNYLLLK